MKIPVECPAVFRPLESPARFKGAWGGRGSGKSWHFACKLVRECLRRPGLRGVCAREFQKTLSESAKRLLEDSIQRLGVGQLFTVQHDRILTPGGGMLSFWGLSDQNAQSIKSLEGTDVCWVEEAQTLSARSLSLLRPTIRAEGSEIWFTWNPTRKVDAVDVFLRQSPPPGAIVLRANWSDNPFFPGVLEEERQLDLERFPDRYDHIWEGGYARAFEGAYFAAGLAEAQEQGRIGEVAADPLLPIRAYWDLGGSGAAADANAIWIVQFAGRQVRVLDYIKGQGQVLAYYTNELRSRGYGRALCFLPHDGVNANVITGRRYRDHLEDAGFDVTVIPNQGRGAAMMRIEAVRRLFPQIWFNEKPCEAGLEALGSYHERRDDQRNAGLGPNHDWSSHAADAFGLMAVAYEEPHVALNPEERRRPYRPPSGKEAWLGG